MRQEIKTMLVTCDGCLAQHTMTGVKWVSRFTPDGWREVERGGRTRLLCGDCAKAERAE